ncbi:MAG: AAA family ATPase [Desulfobacteria bacterium]
MIERLILSRFRGIRKGVIKDMGKINLLVGPNNSGKTAILEAIYWMSVCGRQCGIYSRDLPELMDEDGLSYSRNAFVPMEMDLLGLSPCSRIWKRHGKSGSWKEAPGSVSDDGALFYNIPHLKKDDPLKSFRLIPSQTEEIRDVEKFDENTLSTIGVFVLDNFKGVDDVLKCYLPDLYPGEFSSGGQYRCSAFTWYPDFIHRGNSLGAWGIEGETADAGCVLFFDFHATGDHFTKDFWWAMRDVPDWRNQLTHAFGKVIDDIGEFRASIEPHPTLREIMQGAIEIEGKGTIPIDDLGDGARHAFKVLAGLTVLADRCKDGKEGIFLWEDPELFMHSKSLCRLIKEVVEIVKDKPIQVFISTQSMEVIAFFVRVLKERQELQDKIRAFRMKLVDDELITAHFKYSNLDMWLQHSLDLRFWDQMDVIMHYQVGESDLEDEE